MVNQIDLDNMSIQQLKSLQRNVEEAIKSYADRAKKQRAKARLEREAQKLGFTLEELINIDVQKPRSSVRPKYRNPDDETQTWSGRGRSPIWVREARTRGLEMNDLLIEDS